MKFFTDNGFYGVSHIKKIENEDKKNSFITPIKDVKYKAVMVHV